MTQEDHQKKFLNNKFKSLKSLNWNIKIWKLIQDKEPQKNQLLTWAAESFNKTRILNTFPQFKLETELISIFKALEFLSVVLQTIIQSRIRTETMLVRLHILMLDQTRMFYQTTTIQLLNSIALKRLREINLRFKWKLRTVRERIDKKEQSEAQQEVLLIKQELSREFNLLKVLTLLVKFEERLLNKGLVSRLQ